MSDLFIQSVIGADGSGTATATLSGVATGSALVAFFFDGAAVGGTEPTTFTVSDGTAYTPSVAGAGSSTNQVYGRIFYRTNVASGTHTITGTTSSNHGKVIAVEVGATGVVVISDGKNQLQVNPGTGTDALTSGSLSIPGAATVIVFADDTSSLSSSDQPTAGTGFTLRNGATSNFIGAFNFGTGAFSSAHAATATAITSTAHEFLTFGIAILNAESVELPSLYMQPLVPPIGARR